MKIKHISTRMVTSIHINKSQKSKRMKYSLLIMTVFLVCSCKHSEDHTHDSEGNHIETNPSTDIPREEYTIWSELSELFVEFPVLVVGEQSRFAAHFTVLDKHQAVTKGKVTVSLIQGTKGIRHIVESPSSPGIFSPVLEPIQAGKSTLQFVLITENYTDTLTIPNVKVFPNLKAAQDALADEEDGSESITFLKEQAWKMEFQTEKVKQKQVFESIATIGKWQISPNNSQTLIANANGKVTYKKKNMLSGQVINKGEVIMTISSEGFTTNNLSGDLEVSKADFLQAKTEYERKRELFTDKIVPQAEFEKVEQKYQIAKAKYEALSKGYSSSGYSAKNKQIIAPISGILREVNSANGSFVSEGDVLFTVGSTNANVLEIQVGTEHGNKLKSINNIWYKTNGSQWSNLEKNHGSILSIDQTVSASKPSISVYAQVNENVNMPQGSFSEVNLSIGDGVVGIVIPVKALMEDYGKYSVIVQLSGESFERRNVIIGKRNGEEIEIVSGLQESEIIVTKGAYQVKMQALSGQAPAHGHAH
jgi:cobalt-zinc-cadmium efflux system membrane fusion protein